MGSVEQFPIFTKVLWSVLQVKTLGSALPSQTTEGGCKFMGFAEISRECRFAFGTSCAPTRIRGSGVLRARDLRERLDNQAWENTDLEFFRPTKRKAYVPKVEVNPKPLASEDICFSRGQACRESNTDKTQGAPRTRLKEKSQPEPGLVKLGNVLLSRALRRSIIAAGGFRCPVRNGMERFFPRHGHQAK